MSSELEILIQLKTQMVSFLDELIETFPNEPDFVIFRIFLKDRIPIEDIMKYIVNNLCPMGDMVKSRNEDFFLKNNILFDQLDEGSSTTVNHFKNLWTSKKVDKEDREVIWRWFQSFIFLGNKYAEIKKS